MTAKPLGQKSYGHIAHVPGSRIGPGDHMVPPGMAEIVCEKTRDKHDHIIVQVKADGSNVSVAKIGDRIIPLGRAGYPADTSQYRQHQLFAKWVYRQMERFHNLLLPGERVCGEWLAQAHGTRYALPHEPFVVFDLMALPHKRVTLQMLRDRTAPYEFTLSHVLSEGPPRSIEWCRQAIADIAPHGELDPIEGIVWRCERQGIVDFLCKWVRPDKVDGKYLPEISGEEIWNWMPGIVDSGQVIKGE